MTSLNVDDFTASASLFPIKLYRMVCDTQCQCMTWGGEGEHLILNTRVFEDELLQQTVARWKYQLKTTSTTSFIRQLHAYGFRKVVEGFGEPNNIRRYYHPYFHRQRPDLLVYMKRSMRSSTGVKKQPLRMLDDSNRQMLMNSIFSQSFSSLDKLSNYPETNFSQLKSGEASQGGEESANKRRRKAPPKKHPSFEDSCNWDEDDNESSPPSMVPRFQFKDSQPPRMYPPVGVGSDAFAQGSMPIVKQEGCNEAMGLHNVVPKEPKPIPSINKLLSVTDKTSTLTRNINLLRNQPDANETMELVKIPKVETIAKLDPGLAHVVIMTPHLKKELGSNDSEEPLDLSLPRPASSIISEKCSASKTSKSKSIVTINPQLPKLSGIANIDELSRKPSPTYDCNVRSASVMDSTTHSQNVLNNKQFSGPFPGPLAGKMVNQNLPPFPLANSRITVPPHSILQPAYIAWPTRGIFCPQTKQWIQSRPSIIPLPYRTQQPSPGKAGPIGPKQNGSVLPIPASWCQDPGKALQDVKEIPASAKTQLDPPAPEGSAASAIQA